MSRSAGHGVRITPVGAKPRYQVEVKTECGDWFMVAYCDNWHDACSHLHRWQNVMLDRVDPPRQWPDDYSNEGMPYKGKP